MRIEWSEIAARVSVYFFVLADMVVWFPAPSDSLASNMFC